MVFCEDDCAAPSWRLLEQSVSTSAAMLFALFIFTLLFLCYKTVTVTEEETWSTKRQRLHISPTFVSIYLLASCVQTYIFCQRTVSKSVGTLSFCLEICACCLYGLDFFLGFMQHNAASLSRGLSFLCTWGVVNCLLFSSVLYIPIGRGGTITWGSLSFLAVLHILQAWHWVFFAAKATLSSIKWQAINIVGVGILLTIFASLCMLMLEMLGDPPMLEMLADEWGVVSSTYFVVTSALTVGFGNLAPVTMVGRAAATGTVVCGMWVMGATIQKVTEAAMVKRAGGGRFVPGVRTRPIIISGSPQASMAQDLIAEIFHSDHADDAEDLHLIFFYPGGGSEMEELINFLRMKRNMRLANHITVLAGSVLDSEHLARVSAERAEAFFVLPNTNCLDEFQEDAENIIRMMAVRRYVPSAQVILLLLKAESKGILADAGINIDSGDRGLTVIAADQFKLQLLGKSIDVIGFCPFVCNLCKSISDKEVQEDSKDCPTWLKEYSQGVGHELYEIELSPLYGDTRQATFSEVVFDILEQNGGNVYLIGLVEHSTRDNSQTIFVNPGPHYRVKPTTSGFKTFGIFIAADRDSVQQCEVNMVFLGRRERHHTQDPQSRTHTRGMSRQAPRQKTPAEVSLSAVVGNDLKQRAEILVALRKSHHQGQQPRRPPLQVLAQGGHILLLCVGASGGSFRLGIEHFVMPLRNLKEVDKMAPIVMLAPSPPSDWETVCDQHQVYFFEGSPLYQMDIERSNFRNASAIFICNVASGVPDWGGEDWTLDSNTICCSRLVEAQLGPTSKTPVMVELKCDSNHVFLPVPPSTGDEEDDLDKRLSAISEKRIFFRNSKTFGPGNEEPVKSRRTMAAKRFTTWGENVTAAVTKFKSTLERQEKVNLLSKASEPVFLQPRFAAGQMFVASVVTSLAANTFYNPSLAELVASMIAADIFTEKVPIEWSGKSYYEYFDHLLMERERLCVGILRRADPTQLSKGKQLVLRADSDGESDDEHGGHRRGKRRVSFIYTAPPAKETTMASSDRVLCFGVSAQAARVGATRGNSRHQHRSGTSSTGRR